MLDTLSFGESYDCSVGDFVWLTLLDFFMFCAFILLFFGLYYYIKGGNITSSFMKWNGPSEDENTMQSTVTGGNSPEKVEA